MSEKQIAVLITLVLLVSIALCVPVMCAIQRCGQSAAQRFRRRQLRRDAPGTQVR